MTIRTPFSLDDLQMELVTFRGGQTEVYREYQDTPGLFQFLGYYPDLCVQGQSHLARVIQPQVSRHQRQCCEAYQRAGLLPGAEMWV